MADIDQINTREDAIIELVTNEHASDLGRSVSDLFLACLFKESELANGAPANGVSPVIAEGITQTVGFHPGRIRSARPQVQEVIKRMPEAFLKSKGGGMSFLNLCNDRDGKQWANLHRTMEQFVQLAIACGMGGYCLPRELWSALPGGMPYVWLDDEVKG